MNKRNQFFQNCLNFKNAILKLEQSLHDGFTTCIAIIATEMFYISQLVNIFTM